MDAVYEKVKAMLATNPVLWTVMFAAAMLTVGWFARELTMPETFCFEL